MAFFFFWPFSKTAIHFLVKESSLIRLPVNTANFFSPLVTGVPLYNDLCHHRDANLRRSKIWRLSILHTPPPPNVNSPIKVLWKDHCDSDDPFFLIWEGNIYLPLFFGCFCSEVTDSLSVFSNNKYLMLFSLEHFLIMVSFKNSPPREKVS